MDINSLSQNVTQDVTTNVTSAFRDVFINFLLIPSLVVTVIFLVLYTVHIIRKYRVEKAIFEIRDILRDMRDNQITPVSTKQPETPTPATSE